MKRTKVALVYDFDETLSVHYMQDYMLIPELGYKPEEFWRAANEWSAKNGVDQITGSMFCFKYAYEKRGIKLTKAKLKRYGEPIDFYNGVEDWFTRINKYGRFLAVALHLVQPPDRNAKPGQQFIHGKGLDQIIVCTGI